jgi:hypothetical protein
MSDSDYSNEDSNDEGNEESSEDDNDEQSEYGSDPESEQEQEQEPKRGTKRKRVGRDEDEGEGEDEGVEPPAKRPRRAASLGRPPVVPTLRMTSSRRGTEGPCGAFMREREISIANAARDTLGFIIQKVTRVFTVDVFSSASGTWAAKDGPALDAYVNGGDAEFESQAYATCTTYWELWSVGADGQVPYRDDRFALCSIIPHTGEQQNTSRGRFVITGEVCLYLSSRDPFDAAGLAFTANNPAVPAAGGLPTRTSDPTAKLTQLGLRPAGPAIWFMVRSSWDSSNPDKLSSKVEEFRDPAAVRDDGSGGGDGSEKPS